MLVIRTCFRMSMAVAVLVADSFSRGFNVDSIALRLRSIEGEELANDSIVNRLKADVRQVQEHVDKSAKKPLGLMLGLAEGYRVLVVIYLKESYRMQRLKDSAGEDSIKIELSNSLVQMENYMRVLWAADSNDIEVLRQFLATSEDTDKKIKIYNRLIVHPDADPGDKQRYLGFLGNVGDTARVLSFAAKCEADTSGVKKNRQLKLYLLFCADTLEEFGQPHAAIRLFTLLAKADPGEFKRIADKAILRLKAAAKE